MNEEWLDMGSDRFAWTSAQSTAADRARVRREALEEAAKVCDDIWHQTPWPDYRVAEMCELAIRALIDGKEK